MCGEGLLEDVNCQGAGGRLVTTTFVRLLGIALLILSFPARSADFSEWDKRWGEYVRSPNSINAFDLYKSC